MFFIYSSVPVGFPSPIPFTSSSSSSLSLPSSLSSPPSSSLLSSSSSHPTIITEGDTDTISILNSSIVTVVCGYCSAACDNESSIVKRCEFSGCQEQFHSTCLVTESGLPIQDTNATCRHHVRYH